LVAEIAGDWHALQNAAGCPIDFARRADLRRHGAWRTNGVQQLGIPIKSVQVHQQRARRR
jgi:hypothetical protein